MIHHIKRRKTVPYTAQQMYQLVDEIEAYPTFVPLCRAARIVSRSEQEVVATLNFSWQGIHKSFTTKNALQKDRSIDIRLVSGPFKHLVGVWLFEPLEQGGCEIIFELSFEFAMGGFLDHLFEPIAGKMMERLVTAFCKQADSKYHQGLFKTDE